MRKQSSKVIFIILILIASIKLEAIVLYDQGRIEVNGIQLLRDSENENAYYYIPPYPRISISAKGDFEFLCIKYVGGEKSSNGGIFHALIQFSLTPEDLIITENLLSEKIPGAVIMGAVPMQDYEGENSSSSFRIVSSVLNQSGEDDLFESELITSGRAPFLPGSKAAVAAQLNPEAASLLWSSFEGSTSDVSVVVEGYFRALVKGFKATIKADLELAYNHFSSFKNVQAGFSRDQVRETIDSLSQSGAIVIDVADMSEGLNIDTEIYENILNIITERVVSMMFDVKEGWGKMPVMENSIKPKEIKERYKRGAFTSFFLGDGIQPYIPDNQLLLKSKQEIRNFKFFLDLNQSTAIKVPVYAAGNIGGFYEEFKNETNYFRIVDLDDPAFQTRDLHFQIDGSYIDCFGDIIDNASILVSKEYMDPLHNPFGNSVFFTKEKLDSGIIIQSMKYNRLGDSPSTWLKYKYKTAWKIHNMDTMLVSDWTDTDLSSISIQPPFSKREIVIDLDRSLLKKYGVQSARIRFGSVLSGKPYNSKMLVLRKDDMDSSNETFVYHDEGQPVVYQVNWYTKSGRIEEELKILEDDYLYLIPPQPDE